MIRIFFASLCFFMVAAIAPAQIGSGMFTDEAAHYSIKATAQWMRCDEATVGAIDEFLDWDNPYNTSQVKMAWQRSTSEKVFYPWVMIEVTTIDMAGWSFTDIETAFDAKTKPDRASVLGQPFTKMVAALDADEMILDRQRKRIIEKYTGTDEDNIPYTGMIVGFLGKAGVVHVGFVGDSRQLDYYLPEFQKFVENFKFDKGWEWTEPSGGQGTGTNGWTANRSQAQADAAAAKDAKAQSRSSSSSSTGYRFRRGGMYGGFGFIAALIVFFMYRWADS